MTENNRAAAYSDRIRGERADNLEQASAYSSIASEGRQPVNIRFSRSL